ncbi:MAG: HAD family phosphatase [Patescibacteria group bacterium]
MENIKLICFDLDKTLITHNSWYELNLALGVTHEEDQQLFNDYKDGKISYEEWQQKLLKLLQRSDKANLEEITNVLSKYTFNEGARDAVNYAKSKGKEVALISGSINILVDLVAKDLGIELAEAANILVFNEENRLKDIVVVGDDKIAKLNFLESFCRKLGIELHECLCVGDGDNDIEMFRKTGRGVTFEDSKIKNEAWKVINGLRDLPTLF